MNDWKAQLGMTKRKMFRAKAVTKILPKSFSLKNQGIYSPSSVFKFFDWSLQGCPVEIDIRECKSTNFYTLTLLILYAYKLKQRGCAVSIRFDESTDGASHIWRHLGAPGLFHVMADEDVNFKGNELKPLLGIRNNNDFQKAIESAEKYLEPFDIEYIKTLRYVLSELLYNTREHGVSFYKNKGKTKPIPSLIQYNWYQTRNEIQFIVADVGIGIKKHLEQTYTPYRSHEEAIRNALRPQVSGTFANSDPYKSKNNAGVGLYMSSNIIRKLNADMHIISGDGMVHVSPRDVTSQTLNCAWPGTIVLVTIRIEQEPAFQLQPMLSEFRSAADREIKAYADVDSEETYFVSIHNYFGVFAEDKEAAIRFRDKRIMPAIGEGRKLHLDFDGVKSSPHSFLSALLATPVKNLGMSAYKKIKITNAEKDIRETIDYIMDENTEN